MLTGFSFCRRTASAEHHHHPCMHTYLSRISPFAFASVSDHTFQQPTLDTRRTSDGQANYVYLQTYDRNAHTFNTSTWDRVLGLDSVCLCIATLARWPMVWRSCMDRSVLGPSSPAQVVERLVTLGAVSFSSPVVARSRYEHVEIMKN